MSIDLAINTKGLTKKFGSFVAVDNIDLKINRGKIFGLIGPNGAGKSTLIRMICGVITPTSGEGEVFGFNVYNEAERIKQNIGYMSQKFGLYEDLTVNENLNFYANIYSISKKVKKNRIKDVMVMAGLEGKEDRMTKHLSGGWKQRLALGCCLMHKPKLLILDEPTSAVDPVSRRIFWEIIYKLAKQGITVLVTTHYMDEAESCDEVAFLFQGKVIADGNPKEIMREKNTDNLEDVFIKYVEEQTGEKVQSSFNKIRFIQKDKEGEH